MATKHAGTGAAVAVLAIVGGLMVLVGVILLLMWMQPGIEHRPSERWQNGTDGSAAQVAGNSGAAPRNAVT